LVSHRSKLLYASSGRVFWILARFLPAPMPAATALREILQIPQRIGGVPLRAGERVSGQRVLVVS
jgi:hypothetical protein